MILQNGNCLKMKKKVLPTKSLICISLLGLFACSSNQNEFVIDDADGALGTTNAPFSVEMKLNKYQATAAREGRLGLIDAAVENGEKVLIPVQLENVEEGASSRVVMMMPDGGRGLRKFKLIESESPLDTVMKASLDPDTGQVMVEEEGKKVLQYNYRTVYEKDVIRLVDEKLEEHNRTERDTFVTASIYAVPRSDYIHPLYGLEGEMLTRDWPEGGHPHHRAIFWAWPEVEYGTQRGDIYALQKVFARPARKIEYINGPVFAQIIAENLWMWENTEPIVREHAVIRVYRASSLSRIIDLTIKLDALKDSITIATRNTDSYGGLNLRMMTPESQEISYFTDKAGSKPLRAWSDFNGFFEGRESRSGLMVLQHQDNPDYPGDWVEYPDLAWVQPTFPASGTRYPLSTEASLILRYRLVVHAGGKPGTDISEKRWDAFHEKSTPIYIESK
jgi:hypothetical protein